MMQAAAASLGLFPTLSPPLAVVVDYYLPHLDHRYFAHGHGRGRGQQSMRLRNQPSWSWGRPVLVSSVARSLRLTLATSETPQLQRRFCPDPTMASGMRVPCHPWSSGRRRSAQGNLPWRQRLNSVFN